MTTETPSDSVPATNVPANSGPANSGMGSLYRLDSVESVAAPNGSEGEWFRYTIVQGTNTIVGFRSGPLAALNPVLREMVDKLNERAGKQLAKSAKSR